MTTIQIPDKSRKLLEGIATTAGVAITELEEAYERAYFSEYVQTSGYFSTDEAKHSYTYMVVQSDYLFKPRQTIHKLVPIGTEGYYISKKSKDRSGTMYAVEQTSKGMMIKRVTCQGANFDIYERLQPGIMYDVLCGGFKDGGLIIDDRSKFDNPVQLGLTFKDFIESFARSNNWKQVSIADAKVNPSRMVQSGTSQFVDKSDWRVVRGFVVDLRTGPKKDGSEWANYTITDETVSGSPVVLADGRTMYPGMTVWLSPTLVKWDKGSYLDFYGPTTLDKDKVTKKLMQPLKASMACFQIIPYYPKELQAGTQEGS